MAEYNQYNQYGQYQQGTNQNYLNQAQEQQYQSYSNQVQEQQYPTYPHQGQEQQYATYPTQAQEQQYTTYTGQQYGGFNPYNQGPIPQLNEPQTTQYYDAIQQQQFQFQSQQQVPQQQSFSNATYDTTDAQVVPQPQPQASIAYDQYGNPIQTANFENALAANYGSDMKDPLEQELNNVIAINPEEEHHSNQQNPQPLPDSNPPQAADTSRPKFVASSKHSNLHITMFPLVSEYLNVAHSMSWSIVTGRQNIELYRMLISCSIACLYSILKEPNLHPFIEIQTRLKLAAILSEESSNWETADQIVTKGVSLAKSNNYLELAMHLKYASIRAMANSPMKTENSTSLKSSGSNNQGHSIKTTLKMLDTAIKEALVVAEEFQNACPYFMFMFQKITVLFNSASNYYSGLSGGMNYINDALDQLVILENFRGQQNHVAHLAFVVHALKTFQLGVAQDEVIGLLESAKEIEKIHGYTPSGSEHAHYDGKMPVPSPPQKISYQQTFMRIVTEILVYLERCEVGKLQTVQQELFQLIDSKELCGTASDPLSNSGVPHSAQFFGGNSTADGAWPLDSIEIPIAPYQVTSSVNNGSRAAKNGSFNSTTVSISWLSLSEARILSYMLAGVIQLKLAGKQKNARQFLREALRAIKSELAGIQIIVNTDDKNTDTQLTPPSMTLSAAKRHHSRFLILKCYTLFLLALERFLLSKWTDDQYLSELLRTVQSLPHGLIADSFLPLTYYLSGVYFQASGNLHNAIQFFVKIRQHRSVGQDSEMYILATINLVTILEGPDGKKYNSFQTIARMETGSGSHGSPKRGSSKGSIGGLDVQHSKKEGTESGQKNSYSPSQYYRKELLKPICMNHPSPMIQWAVHLLEAMYDNKASVEEEEDLYPVDPTNGNSEGRNPKSWLAVLLSYAMSLNTPQVGTIVACITSPGIDDLNKRKSLLQRGLSDAVSSHNALWGWMNGLLMEILFRQMGDMGKANEQAQKNQDCKAVAEGVLNRVD